MKCFTGLVLVFAIQTLSILHQAEGSTVQRWKIRHRDVGYEKSMEILSQKLQKMLAAPKNSKIEKAKQDIEKQVEFNFLKTLSVFMLHSPPNVKEQENEIQGLMKSILNEELDFSPVVDKLPSLVKENDTNRLTILLKTIQEKRSGTSTGRQFGGLQNIDKILDAMSKINVKEVSLFLKEIPELFEGVQSIVDGVEEFF